MILKASNRLLFFFIAILLVLPLISAYELTYDTDKNTVTSNYDSLNRILNQTTDSLTTSYNYDSERNGTLSNVTTEDMSVSYEYDSRNRITRETRIIDGITFEKTYSYDSMDRITDVSGPTETFSLDYGDNALLESITGLLDILYTPSGLILNKTFDNSLTTEFSYDDNWRITQIKTEVHQDINYDYDTVGNIISIIDNNNSNNQTMSYDELNRLISATLNGSVTNKTLVYDYNSLGNIISVFEDSDITLYLYDGTRPHTPSEIGPIGEFLNINLTYPRLESYAFWPLDVINWTFTNRITDNIAKFIIQHSIDAGSTWTNITTSYGEINTFNSSLEQEDLELLEDEEQIIYVRIPKTANITRAELIVWGQAE